MILEIVTEDPNWFEWSSTQVMRSVARGNLIINPIIYAEVSIGFAGVEALETALPSDFFQYEPLPWNTAFLAGKAFLQYRQRSGDRRSPLPDFYIGAHATVLEIPLLTKDVSRYRTYFSTLELIVP
ncbi:DNA-binding protein [Stenomitos frigidus AS-A4]|uniref:DNA-binding protein n=1 Tax=Stenomitos frigidus AS-A4 TaxID=2933935 RepID=A0ABV0KKQ1_9CYAN